MVPIVAGLIAGEGANVTRGRAFSLSLAYVLGMAATYTAAGVAFAAAGQQAQTLFQQPWIILLFSALFVAMAISMFGFYTVQMPSFIQTRLTQMSNQQKSGSYAGVAVMGALSALIVTTCVGPALVAALSVIGQSGQIARGGVALFSHGHRHGCAAAGGRRVGGPAAAARRRVDGHGQAGVWRIDAGGGGVDAVAHPARALVDPCPGWCR